MADESHMEILLNPVQHQMKLESLENEEKREEMEAKNVAKKCEAMSMFDEEVRLLFEEQNAESRRQLERHHQRLEETTRKELEAGLKRQLKMEQLKSAEKQQEKLERVMVAVEKREKERAKILTRASSEKLTDVSTGNVVMTTTTKKDNARTVSDYPATDVPTRKRSEEHQTRWRQLLVESNKQAKICRDMAAEEVKQADLAVKAANRESSAEAAKQFCEAKSKLEASKRNLLAKYREARIFQRILEKEEEDDLQRQHERDEFFAQKMAAQARRQLMDAEDKLVEDRRLVELKEKVEKAERCQKMQVRRTELRIMAEEKHRQLREKYRQAEADLGEPEGGGDSPSGSRSGSGNVQVQNQVRRRVKQSLEPKEGVFAFNKEGEGSLEDENFMVRAFVAIVGFFYWLFHPPCSSTSEAS